MVMPGHGVGFELEKIKSGGHKYWGSLNFTYLYGLHLYIMV